MDINRVACAIICGLDRVPPCAGAGNGDEGDGMASAGMAWHGGEAHGLRGDVVERQEGWPACPTQGGGMDMAGLGGHMALPQTAPLQNTGLGGDFRGIGITWLAMTQLAGGLGGLQGLDGAPLGGLLALDAAFWFGGGVEHAPSLSVWWGTHIESIWDETRRMHTYLGIAFASCSSRARRKWPYLILGAWDLAGAPGRGADASSVDGSAYGIVDSEDTAVLVATPGRSPAIAASSAHFVLLDLEMRSSRRVSAASETRSSRRATDAFTTSTEFTACLAPRRSLRCRGAGDASHSPACPPSTGDALQSLSDSPQRFSPFPRPIGVNEDRLALQALQRNYPDASASTLRRIWRRA